MKLVAVLGSSREHSVSRRIAQRVIDGALEQGAQLALYESNTLRPDGCTGCGCCRKNGTDCIIQDGMQAYYRDLHDCDALLVSAPNYYSQIAGPMITFMNRHYCMTNPDRTSRLQPGIRLVGVFAQGAPENYPKYQPTYDWYLSTFLSKGMTLAGKLVAGSDSDLTTEGALLTQAYELGRHLFDKA